MSTLMHRTYGSRSIAEVTETVRLEPVATAREAIRILDDLDGRAAAVCASASRTPEGWVVKVGLR